MFGYRKSPRSIRSWGLARGELVVGLVAVATIALHPGDARSAAWVQNEGEGQAIVSGLYSQADEAFLDDGRRTEPIDFQKGAVSLLVDYGLLTWLTVTGGGEFGSESSDDLPFRRPGLSNAFLGGRAQIYRSDTYAMSAELGVRTEDAYGEADREVDTFGWDSPLLEARWSGGANFSLVGRPAFADVSLGYRYRIGEGPDEVVVDTALGVRAFERTSFIAQSFSTVAVGAAEETYERQKAQGSVLYDLSERWSLQTGIVATVAGRNALKERGGFAALWYRF